MLKFFAGCVATSIFLGGAFLCVVIGRPPAVSFNDKENLFYLALALLVAAYWAFFFTIVPVIKKLVEK